MRILCERGGRGAIAIAMDKGETLFVTAMIPDELDGLAEVTAAPKQRARKFLATANILAVVEGLSLNKNRCLHVRHVRMSRPAGWPQFVRPQGSPPIRSKLRAEGVPRVHALGGLENVVVYEDEILVPDYTVQGAYGWVVRIATYESKIAAREIGEGILICGPGTQEEKN